MSYSQRNNRQRTTAMNTLLLLAAAGLSVDALVHFFIILAIVALIVWGIIALLKVMGWTIPQPVWIVFTVLAGIFLIVWLAKIFGFAV